ncbi:MAG: hypothetical protein R6U62_06005 [Bacteroidales bacterium]
MKQVSISAIVIVLLSFSANSQEKVTLQGYVKSMQTLMAPETIGLSDVDILSDNLIHNRLKFRYYASDNFTVAMEMRNRFLYGEITRMLPELMQVEDYGEVLDKDRGYLDLSKTIASGKGYVLHSMIDRAYVDYVNGNFEARLGRQRINWGINMVWNPNDIFNTMNYFDFDYEERPGTDAIKLQYYTDVASSAELVYEAADSWDQSAVAGMYRMNKGGYDWQMLAGYLKKDYVLGAGWSGHIDKAGFRGEATYFRNSNNFADTTGHLVASISADYMFQSSLYLHGGALYNSEGSTGDVAREGQFLSNQQLSVKTLTPAKSSLFLQMRYQFTPLLTGAISAIVNPHDESFFLMPQITYSLSDNISMLLTSQFFSGEDGTEFGGIGQIYYLRIKWSF